jgi:predicted porin
MNKKLVALAVAGALALPLAAQAQTANVTLYGSLRVGLVGVAASDSTAGKSTQSMTRVDSNSTRFGFKGEEDLGGGMKAIFLIETGFDASANGNNSVNVGAGGNTTANAAGTSVAGAAGNTIASRDTYVGLTGGFGTVRLGQFDSPYKNIDLLTARFLDTGIQAQTSLQSNCSGTNSSFAAAACFDRRQVNQVRYDTPNLSGFTAAFMWAAENEGATTGQTKATNLSTNVLYQNGPFKVGATYEKHEDFFASASNTSFDDDGFKIAGNWTFGAFNLGGVYEALKYKTASGDLKRNYFMVTGAWTMGASELIGSFGRADAGKGGCVTSAAGVRTCEVRGAISGVNDNGAKQFTLGANYNLSKRTQLFTYYTKIVNEKNADYRFSINSFATGGAGADPSGFEMGIVHSF